jgi:hypothetical protein
MNIFLITFLSCSQVQAIAARLQNIALLTSQQKNEIIEEIKKVVPSCPVIIKNK